eukprot:EG_transcript_7138
MLFVVACLLLFCPQCQSYRALLFADVHVDPFYGTPEAEGARDECRNGSLVSPWGTAGCCPPPQLLQSALDFAKTQETNPLFVAFLGDTVRWNAEAMPDAVNATIQIVRDVYTQTRATFPGVPLMFVLGNHDTIPEWSTEVCTASRCQPDPMLAQYAAALADVLPAGQAEANSTFRRGGFYAVDVPAGPAPLTVLSLNSLVLVGGEEADPNGMFAWTEATLRRVRAREAKAYILMHICPINHHLGNSYLWSRGYVARYVSIAQAFGDVIELHACGHEHREGFRTFEPSLAPSHGPMFIAAPFVPECPDCSPAFLLLQVNQSSLAVVDYTLYTANLSDVPPQWAEAHTFRAYYGVPTATNDQLRLATLRMLSNDTLWDKYLTAFQIGTTCTDSCRWVMLCNMLFRVQTSFDVCALGLLKQNILAWWPGSDLRMLACMAALLLAVALCPLAVARRVWQRCRLSPRPFGARLLAP